MKKINCILLALLFLIMGCSSNTKINEEQISKEGIEDIRKYFEKGKTIVFLGSSGVGKSTLRNTHK